jgi:hypothetical protein
MLMVTSTSRHTHIPMWNYAKVHYHIQVVQIPVFLDEFSLSIPTESFGFDWNRETECTRGVVVVQEV